ncbi:ATP-binding cassette domain-containing protein [uncultured Traorella sp.]|uniref:ABC transporter ATP-binding protein n=1 Tax=uncultured Traorella sp. TaxID=1929048 RepID=UPI0025CEC42C|nr:ATP-binding cassette domain-containing protein [uncultured Traorella sp.]
MLSIEHLTKYYGSKVGVKDLSFKIKKGKILGVLGSNGSGKTTTFRVLLGLIEKDEGKITYEGQLLDFSDKCLFGYLPEEKSMLRDLKVKDQIAYLASLKKIKQVMIEEQMDYWLKYFHIERYRNAKVRSLSKGNMQLVQLVCALVHQPKILIFDEPLNGLDLENVGLFKRLCEKLKKEGRIILISSHQYNNIEDLVDDVVYLYRGDTCFKGNLKNLKKKYPQRILILDEDIIDEKDSGVISVEKLGHLYHVKLENEHVASQYVRKLMREKISCFSLEMVSLQMMIREALHERTR